MTDSPSGPASRVNGPYVTETFNSAICRRLLDYWRSKHSGDALPALAHIDLMDIYDIAPFVAVCDAVNGGAEFIARFFGTGIVTVFGFDRTGKTVHGPFAPDAAEMVLARYRLPYITGRPTRVVGYLTAVGKEYPSPFEAVYLPLRGRGGGDGIQHVIGACDLEYKPLPSDNIKY